MEADRVAAAAAAAALPMKRTKLVKVKKKRGKKRKSAEENISQEEMASKRLASYGEDVVVASKKKKHKKKKKNKEQCRVPSYVLRRCGRSIHTQKIEPSQVDLNKSCYQTRGNSKNKSIQFSLRFNGNVQVAKGSNATFGNPLIDRSSCVESLHTHPFSLRLPVCYAVFLPTLDWAPTCLHH